MLRPKTLEQLARDMNEHPRQIIQYKHWRLAQPRKLDGAPPDRPVGTFWFVTNERSGFFVRRDTVEQAITYLRTGY